MELEEWLSSITKVGHGSDDATGIDSSVISGLVEQTTHQIDSLKELVMRGEEQRMRTDGRLASLAEAISVLAKQISTQSRGKAGGTPEVMERVADGQDRIVEALGSMGEGMDAEARMRLRNIDVQLLRVLEEMSSGRQDSIAEIRQDFATLIYTLQQAIKQDEG